MQKFKCVDCNNKLLVFGYANETSKCKSMWVVQLVKGSERESVSRPSARVLVN